MAWAPPATRRAIAHAGETGQHDGAVRAKAELAGHAIRAAWRSTSCLVAARATTSAAYGPAKVPAFLIDETIGLLARSWEIVVVPGAAGMTGVPLPRTRTNVVAAAHPSLTVATLSLLLRASSCGYAA